MEILSTWTYAGLSYLLAVSGVSTPYRLLVMATDHQGRQRRVAWSSRDDRPLADVAGEWNALSAHRRSVLAERFLGQDDALLSAPAA